MRCLEFHTLTSCISGPQKGHSSFNDNKQTDNVQGSMYYTLHESYLIKAAKTILTYTGPQGEQQGKKNASSLSEAKRTSELAMRHFQTANDLKFIKISQEL